MTTTTPPRSRMSAERLAELYSTVLELLLEVGYERLTLDAVAARARTSKMTLYRQWEGKVGLVMAAVRHSHIGPKRRSSHRTLDEAFESMCVDAGRQPTTDTRLGFALLQAASDDAELARTLREEIIVPAAETLRSVFENAADRGEIVRQPEVFDTLAHTIIEHFVLQGLLDGQPDTPERRRAYFATVIRPALTFTRTAAD